jgi:hypothetical protein
MRQYGIQNRRRPVVAVSLVPHQIRKVVLVTQEVLAKSLIVVFVHARFQLTPCLRRSQKAYVRYAEPGNILFQRHELWSTTLKIRESAVIFLEETKTFDE